MSLSVKHAVLPVAGLGTRFLPATKVVPKEMLPLAGRPLIEYAVREVRAAGILRSVLVTAPGRDWAVRHFRPDPGLEAVLAGRGRTREVEGLRELADLGQGIEVVHQETPSGLGDAVRQAVTPGSSGPVAVVLPDDLVLGDEPCMAQLLSVHARLGGTVIAVTEVPSDDIRNFGAVAPGRDDGSVVEILGLVEKPDPAAAPSRLAVIGRYVLAPEVLAALDETRPGAGGEVQLTDAIAATLGSTPVHGLRFEGRRFDCGNPAGFLEASLAVALEDPDLRDRLGEALGTLVPSARTSA